MAARGEPRSRSRFVIPVAFIDHWRTMVPWVDQDQVEQDLLLSRMILEIARDPLLSNELAFRGGTCLHKLWLRQPWRFSEDLDYVRASEGGVGDVLSALRDIGDRLGFDRVTTSIGAHPKARFRTRSAAGTPLSIKVEINTFERAPSRAWVQREHRVNSPWFTETASVRTFELPELMATKIRALFQRRKGRDVFDLWLAVRHGGVDPEEIASCFEPYRPPDWSVARALLNLERKAADPRFLGDIDLLVVERPTDFEPHGAIEVARAVIAATGR